MTDPRVRLQTTALQSSDSDFAGRSILQMTSLSLSDGEIVTFATPSVANLALDAAVRFAMLANACRSTLVNENVEATLFSKPTIRVADGETSGALFDTFQHSMAAAIFSYLAVENFANEVIGRHPDKMNDITLPPNVSNRRRSARRQQEKKVEKAAKGAERESLNDKLVQILPKITGISIDRGRAPYQQFRKLEKMRHDVVHMKSSTSSSRVKDLSKVAKQPVWENFIYENSLWMPDAALQVIRHFRIETLPLDWLSGIEARIRSVDPTEMS